MHIVITFIFFRNVFRQVDRMFACVGLTGPLLRLIHSVTPQEHSVTFIRNLETELLARTRARLAPSGYDYKLTRYRSSNSSGYLLGQLHKVSESRNEYTEFGASVITIVLDIIRAMNYMGYKLETSISAFGVDNCDMLMFRYTRYASNVES